jgi:hypothetical protein
MLRGLRLKKSAVGAIQHGAMATGSTAPMTGGVALITDLAAASAAAAARLRSHVRRTPLERSPWLSAAGGCDAYLKLESEQVTGSFKARGAVNKLLTLSREQLERGLVTWCAPAGSSSAPGHRAPPALRMPMPV